jgi:hypothetical protein
MTRSSCPGTNRYFCGDDEGTGGTEEVDGTISSSRSYMVVPSSSGATEYGDYVIRFEGRLTP